MTLPLTKVTKNVDIGGFLHMGFAESRFSLNSDFAICNFMMNKSSATMALRIKINVS